MSVQRRSPASPCALPCTPGGRGPQIGLAATQSLVSLLYQELSRASVTPYVRKAALSVISQMCAKNPTGASWARVGRT